MYSELGKEEYFILSFCCIIHWLTVNIVLYHFIAIVNVEYRVNICNIF